MHTSPLSCPRCGTVLSAGGGRCPSCGARQPQPVDPLPMSQRVTPHTPMRYQPPEKQRPGWRKAVPLAILAVGLSLVGLAALLFAPGATPEAPPVSSGGVIAAVAETSAARPIDPNDLGVSDPSAASPWALLARAKTRALAWSQDAILVSIEAGPIEGTAVNLTDGGTIVYEFGRLGRPGLAPGSRVASERLSIEIAESGTTVREHAGTEARAATDPNCPLEEAIVKTRASGLSADAPLEVTYGFSSRHDKAAWMIRQVDDEDRSRTVDGWTCAILVR